MVIPLTSEEAWSPIWAAAKSWQPPRNPLLVVAPHPDDETLAAGGFISMQVSSGIPVRVVAITDGENAYEDGWNLAGIRKKEQINAIETLGLSSDDVVRLGLTDSGLANEEATLVDRLLPLVSKDTHILAPWTGDFHPDHEACGRAAQELARLRGAALTFYFFWTWHRGWPRLLQNLPLRAVKLNADLHLRKLAALSQYRSQLEHPSGEPILPDNLLWPVRRTTEVFLPV